MPRAHETSILEDLSDAWKELTKEQKSTRKADKEDWEKAGHALSLLASMYYIRRTLRKKGAPEWVAYAASTIDLTLTQIVMRLYWIEKQLQKKTSGRSRLQLSDLSLRPGEGPADVLERVRKLLS